MTREEISSLIASRIEGQGNQVDLGNALPTILRGILDLLGGEDERVGDLASLDTDHKSNLVEAINEIADLVETPHFVISFSKSSAELKEVYEECKANLVLAKNIVFYNSNTNLYYRVNGYNMVNNVLKLHALIGATDTTINLSSNGTLSVG